MLVRALRVAIGIVALGLLSLPTGALAATGDLTFAQCVEDEDSNFEAAKCANAPGLDRASSVTSPDGRSVYVASSFDDALVNFQRDPGTGALSLAQCFEDEDSNFEGAKCADVPGLFVANSVASSPDGTSIYVTGADTVVSFDRDPTTGALSFRKCFDDEDTNVEGAKCNNAPGLGTAASVAASGDGESVYVAARGDNAIANFSRNPSTGGLGFADCVEDDETDLEGTACADAPALQGAASLAASADGRSLYVATGDDWTLVNFDRDPTTGALSFAECFDDEDLHFFNPECSGVPAVANPASVAASADGKSVYVASGEDWAIANFNRDGTTGALTFAQCLEAGTDFEGAKCADTPAGLAGPDSIAVSMDGMSAYLASNYTSDTFESTNAIVTLARNPATGAISFVRCIEDEDTNLWGASCANAPGLEGATSVAVGPRGGSVYAAAADDDAVVRFGREHDATPPLAPQIQDTDPDSPANDNDPEVKGTAEADSTVRIYSTADCSGTPLASGSAATFLSPGITVSVPDNSTTQLRATATDASGNTSPCSAALAYVEDSTPPPGGEEPQPEQPPVEPKADRTVTFDASKGKVERGRRVGLSGQVDAPQNGAACQANQTVELQRKEKGTPDSAFETFRLLQSDQIGSFATKVRVRETFVYRAHLPETEACQEEVSNTEKVRVQKPEEEEEA